LKQRLIYDIRNKEKHINIVSSFEMKLTYEIKKSNWKIKSFGGSIIMFAQMNKIKIEEKIYKELKKPGSGGYSTSLYVKSLITLLHLGGENIVNVKLKVRFCPIYCANLHFK
jgi:hypothetical protein